ncbi:hypothetical protein ACLB1G_13005 [Oxalobacteraceae bacterium A2-2]
MSAAAPYCAFQGDPARKAEMLDRVRAKWAQRRVFPLPYLKWRTDGGMVSMAGALAETQAPEQFIERTGLPIELAALCEGLVYSGVEFSEDATAPLGLALKGGETILAFAIGWLEAIPVGADLGDLVPRFMQRFLASVLAPDFPTAAHLSPPVRACAEQILGLWARELDGAQVAPKEWRGVRAAALRASEEHGAAWDYGWSELVESLAWPARGLALEFASIFQLFVKEMRQLLAAPYLSSEDRALLPQALAGLAQVTRAQRDPELSQLPIETLLERDPQSRQAVLTFTHPDMQARVRAAEKQARPESDRVLGQQMAMLRSLIEAAGQLPTSAA